MKITQRLFKQKSTYHFLLSNIAHILGSLHDLCNEVIPDLIPNCGIQDMSIFWIQLSRVHHQVSNDILDVRHIPQVGWPVYLLARVTWELIINNKTLNHINTNQQWQTIEDINIKARILSRLSPEPCQFLNSGKW